MRRPASTARLTTCAPSSTRRTATGSASSSTSSTTTSARQPLRRVQRPLVHRPLRERVGRIAELRRRGLRTATTSRRTPPTGSPSSTSMASASMRPRRCSTPPRITSLPGSPARRGRPRPAGGPADRRERTETRLAPRAGGRVRPRRALERRLPSFRACRPDRPARSLLPRLPRRAAGVRLGGAIRLSFSGAAVRLAGRAPRGRRALAAADRLRHLPREPRSGRQLGPRPAAACAGEPRAPAGADGAAPAVAADPNALPGAGVLGFRAVSLLRRSRPRA